MCSTSSLVYTVLFRKCLLPSSSFLPNKTMVTRSSTSIGAFLAWNLNSSRIWKSTGCGSWLKNSIKIADDATAKWEEAAQCGFGRLTSRIDLCYASYFLSDLDNLLKPPPPWFLHLHGIILHLLHRVVLCWNSKLFVSSTKEYLPCDKNKFISLF